MKVVLSLLVAALLSTACFADEAADKAAVEAAVISYLEGVRDADREKLETAFDAPNAHMKGFRRDGSIGVYDMRAIIDAWSNENPDPTMTGAVLSIDVYHGRIAHAVFDFNGQYLDLFQLAKVGEEWKIVNKLYMPIFAD